MTEPCITGKVQHNTRQNADKSRRKMAIKNIRNRVIGIETKVLNVYQCPFCPYWHVGHSKIEAGND